MWVKSMGFRASRRAGRSDLAEKKRGLPLTCYPSSALVNAVLKEAETAAIDQAFAA